LPLQLTPALATRLETEHLLWLTTVRADGIPQPTPVWFLWRDGKFLLFSQPTAYKVRNMRSNPNVTLNFNTDPTGEIFAVFTGVANIDETGLRSLHVPEYIEKYGQELPLINFTPQSLSDTFSLAFWVTPTKVRAQGF
jgi:PPOX class probable F420-dependent enzyme